MLTVLAQTARWWLGLTLTGLAALPVTFWLFGRLPGKGIAFARPLGLLLVSYLLWLGVSLGALRNDASGLAAGLAALLALSAWLALRKGGNGAALADHLRRQAAWILVSEALFLLALLGWAWLRATSTARAMPAGGEKFMEMAFFNAVLNSPTFPPQDPWLAGFSISYYYFGYVMMAALTRLCQLPSETAYELYDALLFAFSLQLSFWLVSEMAALSGARRVGRLAAGLAAGFCTTLAGNLEGALEALYARGWLPPAFSAWLALPGFPPGNPPGGSFYPGADWWWWRASRVISDLGLDGKPLGVNPISEFPFFSFLLGDNHPHVLALPFVLLAAGCGLEWAVEGGRMARTRLAFSAVIFGALIFLNTWDFPALFGLALMAYLAGEYARSGELARASLSEALQRAAWLGGGAILLYLPFLRSFSSQAGGLLPYIFPPTRLSQYLVMFGLPVSLLLFFLAVSLRDSGKPRQTQRLAGWWLACMLGFGGLFASVLGLAALALWIDELRGGLLASSIQPWLGGGGIWAGMLQIIAARLASPWLFLLLTLLLSLAAAGLGRASRAQSAPLGTVDSGLRFARLLALTGLGLTFAVEFFYLRDSFGVRMNTLFKFYFLGWILLGCAAGYAAWWLAVNGLNKLRLPVLAVFCLLSAASLTYPLLAIRSRTDGYLETPKLDAALFLRQEHPDDWAAIDWLKSLPRSGSPAVILEAPCGSYCFGGRISAFSGYPTVLGWADHEGQWRGNFIEQNRRLPDIAAIYTGDERQNTLDLLHKWGVRYLVLGETERGFIQETCARAGDGCTPESAAEKLNAILVPVFRHGSITIYQVP